MRDYRTWSIGGFAATWAGRAYPELGGLVLDATFDDLVPLALARMPASWNSLVEESVREYLDLPIMRQLISYHGPISLIRRTKDEVICLDESSPDAQRATNRANTLLRELLRHRYPIIMSDKDDVVTALVDDWLASDDWHRRSLEQAHGVSKKAVGDALQQLIFGVNSPPGAAYNNGIIFPISRITDLGQQEGNQRLLDLPTRKMLALYLAQHYFADFDSTHCVPLPGAKFSLPVHPWQSLEKDGPRSMEE